MEATALLLYNLGINILVHLVFFLIISFIFDIIWYFISFISSFGFFLIIVDVNANFGSWMLMQISTFVNILLKVTKKILYLYVLIRSRYIWLKNRKQELTFSMSVY